MLRDNGRQSESSRILLVDDDRRLLSALEAQLSALNCRCTVCDNASEAMAQFSRGGFDLVITDLTMPGLDGLGIVGMIRSQSEVPIVVVTGHSAEYARSILAYDNVALIQKPVKPLALMASVGSLLLKNPKPNARLKCG
jgi:DNA-binding response OmpR family regulator